MRTDTFLKILTVCAALLPGASADALLARMAEAPSEGRPAPVIRSMENLKLALRLRFQRGPIDAETADAIAAAIDAAALKIEQL